jgi:hypothetical protein
MLASLCNLQGRLAQDVTGIGSVCAAPTQSYASARRIATRYHLQGDRMFNL